MKSFIIGKIGIGLLLIATLASCGSSKKAKRLTAPTDQMEYSGQIASGDTLKFIEQLRTKVKESDPDFETFNAKAKVSFTDKDDKTTDVNVIIRIQKDKVIWVSVNALLGIEAARVLITPDSVKLINKIDKKIVEHSVSYLQELVNLPLDFYALQDLLLGNPLYLKEGVAYQNGNDLLTVLSVNDKIKSTLQFEAKKYIFLNAVLSELDPTSNRVSTIVNSEHERKNKRWFPLLRNIRVEGNPKASIVIQFRQYEFNETVNFPFNYPKDYSK